MDWTYELSWKELRLLEMYPFFFDDEYWYWHPKTRRGAVMRTIIKRAPLWTYPQKSVPAEKHKLRDPRQRQFEYSTSEEKRKTQNHL